jgi:alkylhydroperoxidase family enzyme
MHALAAWRESDSFDARERAALELCEAMTLIAGSRVPDDVYREAERMFEPDELAGLIWTIVTINAWNRVAITTRMLPKP